MADFQQKCWKVLWLKRRFFEQVPVGSEKQSLVGDELAYGRVKIAKPLSEGGKWRVVSVGSGVDVLEFMDTFWQVFLGTEVVLGRDIHHVLVKSQKLHLENVVAKSFLRSEEIIDALNEVTNSFVYHRLEECRLNFVPLQHFCVLLLDTLFNWIGFHLLIFPWPEVIVHQVFLSGLLCTLLRLLIWLSWSCGGTCPLLAKVNSRSGFSKSNRLADPHEILHWYLPLFRLFCLYVATCTDDAQKELLLDLERGPIFIGFLVL